MGSTDDLLSFMDLLDLDEELVNARLKTIMARETFTKKHLVSAIQLLKYKYLINLQEDTECENDEECDFIARLVAKINSENVDNVCEIVNIALNLNKTSIVSKSEHLIQQILSNIDLPSNDLNDDAKNEEKSLKTLLNLKLCDSILSALLKNGEKVSLLFLEYSLERVLLSSDEKLKIHFLTSTVPKLFQGSIGFNILDKIWDYLQQYKQDDKDKALKILSCLSEYYIPVVDSKGNFKYQSEIVHQYSFWNLLLNGMLSIDSSVRKVAIYLMKRTIDNLMAQKRDIQVHDEISILFFWEHKNEILLKQMWDNFFILIDSLEEKQSNIVLPSLQLFDTLNSIPACWLSCAFNMGLKHDNLQIQLKCIEYCLRAKVHNKDEAKLLLEALNNINIYDNTNIYPSLMNSLQKYFENVHTFVHIFDAIPKVKWSPIPFYHISKVLAVVNLKEFMLVQEERKIAQNITEILKIPCNNIAIRKAVHINVSYFIGNCCKNLHWKYVTTIFTAYSTEMINFDDNNPFLLLIKSMSLDNEEKTEFLKIYANIELAGLYLKYHPDSVDVLQNIIDEKLKKIHDVLNRQYSDKTECLKDIIYIMQLSKQTDKTNTVLKETVQNVIAREYKSIVQYLLNLLSCDVILSIEDMILLFQRFKSIPDTLNDLEAKYNLLHLYKSSVLFLRDKYTDIDKKVFSLHVVEALSNNTVLNTQNKHEILTLEQTLDIINKLEFKDNNNAEDNGRYRNLIYEKSCKLIFALMKEENAKEKNYKEVLNFIEKVTECGGYGCLKWILRIMNEVLALIIDDDKINFNVPQFVNRMWREIEELKSNNQYSPCIEQFVNLITQESLLKKSMYNNLVILYCSKIIEYGPLKNSPLFFLAKKLDTLNITVDYGQLIYVLCEMLLFAPVPKKNQRIMDNIAVEILNEPKYGLHKEKLDTYFNYQIQYTTVSILSKISNQEILETIISFMITKVDDVFKNKPRYHGNSQVHRTLLICLQHLLLMMLKKSRAVGTENVLTWSMELLGRLPHQPSVRICLEWFIALNFYEKDNKLDENITSMMTSTNIPIISQFMILYLTIKHKIVNNVYKKDEFEFAMDFLLSHTMGQMFNIRLLAQYLATKLAKINHDNSQKYSYIISVIEKTFVESSKDKNFVKLNEDLFVNDFDIVSNLSPSFVYYVLPKYCDETFDLKYVSQIMEKIETEVAEYSCNDKIKKEWMNIHKTTNEILKINLNKITEIGKSNGNTDLSGTIQKKYIPWKNMSDIETCEVGKKRENSGELIVVASLIDKLPNLGGMARTSEVFGVKTYVIDSVRHLQDKMFQGLSVSAERWVNIEEVRPGAPLKEYLIRKKTEGYCVVAAEQTSTSCPLQTFKFPKKSLLLLGHEKEGIPCDLLPIMDFCVEIPQQGFVRSLNVHVTAAIFVWEYTRQNIL